MSSVLVSRGLAGYQGRKHGVSVICDMSVVVSAVTVTPLAARSAPFASYTCTVYTLEDELSLCASASALTFAAATVIDR